MPIDRVQVIPPPANLHSIGVTVNFVRFSVPFLRCPARTASGPSGQLLPATPRRRRDRGRFSTTGPALLTFAAARSIGRPNAT